MQSSPTDLIWFEKYRPSKLEEMALAPDHRTLLASFIEKKEIPHLLFVGPAGCGKTTVSKMLMASMDCDVMSLNASKDRGIDIIRDRIGMFAKVLGMRKWKVVFLDEADGLTSDAQNSLRNMMEDYHEQTRFIFTGNYKNRIIDAIQSRCSVFEFGETPVRERFLILQRILAAENVTAEPAVIFGYAEKFRDLRKMLYSAQHSVVANKGVLAPASAVAFLGVDLLSLILKNDWNGLVACASNPGFDHRQSLTNMFWAVGDKPEIKKSATWRYALGKAVDEAPGCPDQVVHFLGTCAGLLDMGP